MLGATATSSISSPGLCPRPWGAAQCMAAHVYAQPQAAAFPVAGSAIGKAAHTSRHWGSHRLPQTRCCLQQPHKTPTRQPHALLLSSRQRQEVTAENTRTRPSCIPQVPAQPLCAPSLPAHAPGPPALPGVSPQAPPGQLVLCGVRNEHSRAHPLWGHSHRLWGHSRPPWGHSRPQQWQVPGPGLWPSLPSSCGHGAPPAAPATGLGTRPPRPLLWVAQRCHWLRRVTSEARGAHTPTLTPAAPNPLSQHPSSWPLQHSHAGILQRIFKTQPDQKIKQIVIRIGFSQANVLTTFFFFLISDQHLFTPLLSISTLFHFHSLPLHIPPPSLGSTNNPLQHPGPSGLQPYQF